MIEHKSGVLPSPPDNRDWGISRCMDMPSGSVEAMIPKRYSVSWLPEVKDQEEVNSCTAYSLATICECIYRKLTGETRKFSIGYHYGNRRETWYKDEGQIMRDCPKSLQKYGAVFSDTYECLKEVSEVIDSFEANFDRISPYSKKLIFGYVRLKTEEEAKAFLAKYDIPLFANTTMGAINPLSGNKDALHAMALIGYDGHYFKFRNSWGALDCVHPTMHYNKIHEIWGIIPMEEKTFVDVSEDRWSSEAIQVAANDGIMEGFPDGTFVPSAPVTREQMAVMWERMKRYCEEHYKI